jgi:hypothetical protein
LGNILKKNYWEFHVSSNTKYNSIAELVEDIFHGSFGPEARALFCGRENPLSALQHPYEQEALLQWLVNNNMLPVTLRPSNGNLAYFVLEGGNPELRDIIFFSSPDGQSERIPGGTETFKLSGSSLAAVIAPHGKGREMAESWGAISTYVVPLTDKQRAGLNAGVSSIPGDEQLPDVCTGGNINKGRY